MTVTMEDIDEDYPDREFETGYLLIDTIYTSNPSEQEVEVETIIEANAHIARAVRKIIQSEDSYLKGAVVEEPVNGGNRYYVIVSVSLPKDTWGDEPLQQAAAQIEEVLGGGIPVSSDIRVDKVKPAKDVKVPTGLQGPP